MSFHLILEYYDGLCFTLYPVLIQLHDGLTFHLQMGRNTVEAL